MIKFRYLGLVAQLEEPALSRQRLGVRVSLSPTFLGAITQRKSASLTGKKLEVQILLVPTL